MVKAWSMLALHRTT